MCAHLLCLTPSLPPPPLLNQPQPSSLHLLRPTSPFLFPYSFPLSVPITPPIHPPPLYLPPKHVSLPTSYLLPTLPIHLPKSPSLPTTLASLFPYLSPTLLPPNPHRPTYPSPTHVSPDPNPHPPSPSTHTVSVKCRLSRQFICRLRVDVFRPAIAHVSGGGHNYD